MALGRCLTRSSSSGLRRGGSLVNHVPDAFQDQIVNFAVLRRRDLAQTAPHVARQVDAGMDAIAGAGLRRGLALGRMARPIRTRSGLLGDPVLEVVVLRPGLRAPALVCLLLALQCGDAV